jgi:hypothetical protein
MMADVNIYPIELLETLAVNDALMGLFGAPAPSVAVQYAAKMKDKLQTTERVEFARLAGNIGCVYAGGGFTGDLNTEVRPDQESAMLFYRIAARLGRESR